MSSSLQNLPDVPTFAANIVVFLGAIGAAVAGSFHAVKKIKTAWLESMKAGDVEVTKTQILGGILQDQYGAAMMSETLRDNAAATERQCEAIASNTREIVELRHEINRLIDRMDRNAR